METAITNIMANPESHWNLFHLVGLPEDLRLDLLKKTLRGKWMGY